MDNHSNKGSVWLIIQSIRYSMLSLKFSFTEKVFHCSTNSFVLRKWFLIEVLKCHFNESADNIPQDIRAVVYSIRNMDVEKFY